MRKRGANYYIKNAEELEKLLAKNSQPIIWLNFSGRGSMIGAYHSHDDSSLKVIRHEKRLGDAANKVYISESVNWDSLIGVQEITSVEAADIINRLLEKSSEMCKSFELFRDRLVLLE